MFYRAIGREITFKVINSQVTCKRKRFQLQFWAINDDLSFITNIWKSEYQNVFLPAICFVSAPLDSQESVSPQISAEVTVRSHSDKYLMYALELTADLKQVFLQCTNEGDFFTCRWKLFTHVFMGKSLSYGRRVFVVHLMWPVAKTLKIWV